MSAPLKPEAPRDWTHDAEARLERTSMAAINVGRDFAPARARDIQDVLKSLHDYRHEAARLSALLIERGFPS